MRRARRFRKTPCRPPRQNRSRGGIPPSTRARWDWKLRLSRLLQALYPLEVFVVEDITEDTRTGQRRWNASFSPLEVGKCWFSEELATIAPVVLTPGYETARLREGLGLSKSGRKDEETFWSHCADSWVLASSAAGGAAPEDTRLVRIAPLRFRRRSLHLRQPAKGGARRRHGGTVSLGLRRGTQVLHPRGGSATWGDAPGDCSACTPSTTAGGSRNGPGGRTWWSLHPVRGGCGDRQSANEGR